jgi:hypothetical protein
MMNPSNLTLFKDQMALEILSSERKGKKMNFTWECVKFNNTLLDLQIRFSDPLRISEGVSSN